jgi:CRP-like cAMP-binding protein
MTAQKSAFTSGNKLLAALPTDLQERLGPHLEPVELPVRHTVYSTGSTIEHIYFPYQGLASLVKIMEDGKAAEIGTIGTEGLVGLPAIFGNGQAPFEVLMQVPGAAHRINPAVLRHEMERSEVLRRVVFLYTDFFFDHLAQTAACNRLHSLEERCCRWLLTAHDNVHSDIVPLTHEFLALMLGVRRPGVSLAAGILQKAGLIRYRHGRVKIIDRERLEAYACECYAAIRSRYDLLLGAVT